MTSILAEERQPRRDATRRRRRHRHGSWRQDEGMRALSRLVVLFAFAWVAIGLIAWTSMPG